MMKASKNVPDNAAGVTPDVCPWLTHPWLGYLSIEGRVLVPDGYALPESFDGFALTWRSEGRYWRFIGEKLGGPLDLSDLEHARICGTHPVRVDRASYEAPSRLDEAEDLRNAHLVVEGGQLMAVTLASNDAPEEEPDMAREVEDEVRNVFGAVVVLGDWARNVDGYLEAPVSWRRAVGR